MSNRKSFVFYGDWRESIKDLPNDIRLDIYDAITEYAITGNTPELKPMAKIAFSFIKTTIDRDREKYQSIVERNKKNGSTGGRPIKTQNNPENPVGSLGTQENPNGYDSDNGSVSDSDSRSSNEDGLLLEKEAKGDSSNNTTLEANLPSSARKKTENPEEQKKNAKKKSKNYDSIFWGEVKEGSPYGDGRLHRLCGEWDKENKGVYPPEFFKEFLMYWTAEVQKGPKRGQELWRTKETWSLAGRLATSWRISKKNYDEGKQNPHEKQYQETLTGLGRIFALEDARIRAKYAGTDGNANPDDGATGAVVVQ